MLKRIKRTELQRLLKSNICDLLVVRRRPERAPGRPELRQMLCTNSMEILRSENGLRVLNYSGSFEPKKVDERKHNLVVTWDIFMQDYRNVSMDLCYLVQKIPADDNFWKFFNENIFPMSPNEKMRYMDLELNLDTYQ
jgi:hypothetical protein